MDVIDRVQRWNMAAVCGGRVMFVVVLCMTLMGLAICETNDTTTAPPSPTVQEQLDEINEKLKYGKNLYSSPSVSTTYIIPQYGVMVQDV